MTDNLRHCAVPDCQKKPYARGWCEGHYRRWRKHGDPRRGGALRPRAPKGSIEQWIETVALPYVGDDCLMWPFGKISKGYGAIHIEGRITTASREICARAHGSPINPTDDAAHSCGNGHFGCVNPKHLRWASRAENMADKADHGTDPRGQRNPSSKLCPKDVDLIRRLKGEVPQRAVCERFSISQATVSQIQNDRTWRHQ